MSVYAPLSAGQAKALRRTYEVAGYGPETVELIEAHGTGTKAGDAAEFGGLKMVFDECGRADRQWCAIGSVKSQIGHTKGTAGAAGPAIRTASGRPFTFAAIAATARWSVPQHPPIRFAPASAMRSAISAM